VRTHRCDCDDGFWGARCDCSSATYSLAESGYGSPCQPFTPCAEGHWEEAAPTNTTDRQCQPIHACESDEWEVSPPTYNADRVCKAVTECSALDDLEEKSPPSNTTDRVCQNINDCETLAGICDRGSCYDLGSAMPGQVGCDCSTELEPGWQGEYCDCKYDKTYSQSNFGLSSPCFAITQCTTGQWESVAFTNTSDRECKDITDCPTNFYESTAPTDFSDRACTEVSPSCESRGMIEVEPPTGVSDRVCVDTTTTTTTITTTTATTTTTITTTTVTTIFVPKCSEAQIADVGCINGGECILVKADCADSAAPYDTPICKCSAPANDGKCFYGKKCNSAVTCGTDARSCNPFVVTRRGQNPEENVCKTEAYPPAACSADAPASAEAASGNETPSQDEEVAEASTSGMSIIPAIGAAAALVLLLVGVALVRRRQELRDERDKQAFDSVPPLNPKFMASASAGTGATSIDQASAGSKMGDIFWNDYKRCTSFDHFYYGNQIMQLSDDALVDAYTVLFVKCPPRKCLPALRAVGNNFLALKPSLASPEIADDVVDFVTCSMPDVLIERALDLFATVASTLDPNEYGNDALYEAFYAMITEYDPNENQYLDVPEGGSRALSLEASGDQEPIYFDIKEMAAEPLYSMGSAGTYTTLPAPENPYDLSAEGESAYSSAAGLGFPRYSEGAYDMGQNDMGQNDYDMGRNSDGGYNDIAPHPEEPVYASGNANPTYDRGTHTSVDDIATYGTADALDVGATDDTYDMGSERVYDTGAPLGSQLDTYVMADDTGAYAKANAPTMPAGESDYCLAEATEAANGNVDPLYATADDAAAMVRNEYDTAATNENATYGTATALQVREEATYDNPGANRSSYALAQGQGQDRVYSRLLDEAGEEQRSTSYHEAQVDEVDRNVSDTYTLADPYGNENNADALDAERTRRASAALTGAASFEKLEEPFETDTNGLAGTYGAGFGAGDSKMPFTSI